MSFLGLLLQSTERHRIIVSHISVDRKARRPVRAGFHGGESEHVAPAESASHVVDFGNMKIAVKTSVRCTFETANKRNVSYCLNNLGVRVLIRLLLTQSDLLQTRISAVEVGAIASGKIRNYASEKPTMQKTTTVDVVYTCLMY